jgi:hypothetical protein
MVAGPRSIALGLALLGLISGSTRDAGARANNRTLRVEVNVPYAVQSGSVPMKSAGFRVTSFGSADPRRQADRSPPRDVRITPPKNPGAIAAISNTQACPLAREDALA